MENNNEEKKTPISKKGKTKVNPWMIASIVLGVIVVILLLTGFNLTGNVIGGNSISADAAGQKVIDFANSQTGGGVTLVGVEEKYDLYEVTVSYQGQNIPLFVTKDGENLIQGVTPLVVDDTPAQTQQAPEPSGYSDGDLAKLMEFNGCLAGKGVKVYGANWCGWTKKWVDTLGGFDIAAPIYIECTENQDLCAAEGLEGYPTTKINGVIYSGDRTIAAIAAETGCPDPLLEGTSASASSGDASCN